MSILLENLLLKVKDQMEYIVISGNSPFSDSVGPQPTRVTRPVSSKHDVIEPGRQVEMHTDTVLLCWFYSFANENDFKNYNETDIIDDIWYMQT